MKLGNEELRLLKAFEGLSGVSASDCIIGKNNVTFLVREKDFGKAIGKNGSTIKRVRQKFGKNVELMQQCSDAEMFVKKALYNLKFEDIEMEKNGLMILRLDAENKRKLLNNISRLKRIKEVAKRNYDINDVRIR